MNGITAKEAAKQWGASSGSAFVRDRANTQSGSFWACLGDSI